MTRGVWLRMTLGSRRKPFVVAARSLRGTDGLTMSQVLRCLTIEFQWRRLLLEAANCRRYLRTAGRVLDTSWALKFNWAKADADLNAAATYSLDEKAVPHQIA